MTRKFITNKGNLTATEPYTPKQRKHQSDGSIRTILDDEFYTKLEDVEAELLLPEYQEYIEEHLKNGGHVLLVADSYKSNFWKFFKLRYEKIYGKQIDCIAFIDFDNTETIKERISNYDVLAITNPPFSLLNKFVELFPKWIFVANQLKLTHDRYCPKVISGEYNVGQNHITEFIRPDGKVYAVPCIWLNNVGIKPKPKLKPKPQTTNDGYTVPKNMNDFMQNLEYYKTKEEVLLPITSLFIENREKLENNNFLPVKKARAMVGEKELFTRILWRYTK